MDFCESADVIYRYIYIYVYTILYLPVTYNCICIYVCNLYRRGVNPPHRVKSVSMTTFNEAEIDKLKKGGNEVSVIG